MPPSLDDILASLESCGEHAAQHCNGDRQLYTAALHGMLHQATTHLAPLEKSLVIHAAIAMFGSDANINDDTGDDKTGDRGLLCDEQALIPLHLGA